MQFLVSLILVFMSPYIASANDSSKRDCIQYLTTAPPKAPSQHILSFLRLVEEAVRHNFLSIEDLKNLISQLHNGRVINPLDGKNMSSTSLPYKNAFAQLLVNLVQHQSELIAEIKRILENQSRLDEAHTFAKNVSRAVYNPQIYDRVKIGTNHSLPSSSATSFTSLDGREFIAIGADDGYLYIVDLANPKNQMRSPEVGNIFSKPLYFVNKEGIEMLAFGSQNGNFYVLELNNPNQIKFIKTSTAIRSHPEYFITKSGREILTFTAHDFQIYFLDLSNYSILDKIKTSNTINSSPKYIKLKSGRELFAVSGNDKHLYLIDPEKIENNTNDSYMAISLGEQLISTPDFFTNINGDEILVATSSRGLFLVDLNNPSDFIFIKTKTHISPVPPTYFYSNGRDLVAIGTNNGYMYVVDVNIPDDYVRIPIQGAFRSAPTLINTQINGINTQLLAFGTTEGRLYFINDRDLHNLRIVDVNSPMDLSSAFTLSKTGKQIVSIGSGDGYLNLIELFPVPKQLEISK